MNKNIKRIFLLTTLILLLVSIGAITATDTDNIDISDTDDASTIQEQTSIEQNINTANDNKNIETKQKEEIKTDTNTQNTTKTINKDTKTNKEARDIIFDINYKDVVINVDNYDYSEFQFPFNFTDETIDFIHNEDPYIRYVILVDDKENLKEGEIINSEIDDPDYIKYEFRYDTSILSERFNNGEENEYLIEGRNHYIHQLSYIFYVEDREYRYDCKLIITDFDLYDMIFQDESYAATYNYTIHQGDSFNPNLWIYYLNPKYYHSYTGALTMYLDGIEHGEYHYQDHYTFDHDLLSNEDTLNLEVGNHTITFEVPNAIEEDGFIITPYIKLNVLEPEIIAIETRTDMENINGIRGDSVLLEARVRSPEGSTDGAEVTFYVDNNIVGTAIVSDSCAIYNYVIPRNAGYTLYVRAVVTETSQFMTSEATSRISVNKRTLNITVGNYETIKGGVVNITPTFNDTVNDGKLDIAVDQSNIATIQMNTNPNPSVLYNTSIFSPGNYPITMTYYVSSIFNNVNTVGTLTIKNLNTVSITSPTSAVESTLGGSTSFDLALNASLSDGVLEVYVDGENSPRYTNSSLNGNLVNVVMDTSDLDAGNHTLVVKYTGSSLFKNMTSSLDLTINKKSNSFTINGEKITQINGIKKENVTATLVFEHAVSDGSIIINSNDISMNPIVISETTSSIDLTFPTSELNYDNIVFTVRYTGSDEFNDVTGQNVVTISFKKRNVTLDVSNVIVTYGDTITITPVFNDTVNDGIITVKIIGTDLEAVLDLANGDNSYAEFDSTNLEAKTYNVLTSYTDSSLYNHPDNFSSRLTVNKAQVALTPDSNSISVNKADNADIAVSVDPAIDGRIIFKNNDEVIGNVSIDSGRASLSYNTSQLDVDTYIIDASVESSYYEGSTTISLTVNKKAITVTATGSSVAIRDDATITIELSEVPTEGTLDVYINDMTTPVRIIDTFTEDTIVIDDIDTSAYNIGSNNVLVKYTGVNVYDNTEDTTTITLTKRLLSVTLNSYEYDYGEDIIITPAFNDTLTDGNVVISIANTDKSETINVDDTTTISSQFVNDNLIGSYTVNVDYDDSLIYDVPVHGDTSLTINKAQATITPTSASVTVEKGDIAIISVSVTPSITGDIIFKNNDEILDTIALSDSIATLNYDTSELPIDTYNIDVELDSAYYQATPTSITLTVNSRDLTVNTPESIDVTKNDDITLTITLSQEVNDGIINIYVDEEETPIDTIDELDDDEFTATISSNDLSIGEHTIKVIYSESSIFEDAVSTTTVNVKKRTVDITVESDSVAKGDIQQSQSH